MCDSVRQSLAGRIAASLAIPLSALVVGCEDASAPGTAVGTYALQRVAGEPLPTVLFTTEYVRVQALADTLRLRADGSGTRVSVWHTEPLQAGLPSEPMTRVSAELRYTERGGQIQVSMVCPAAANCTPPPHLVAYLTPEGLLVEAASGERVPMLYGRAASAE